MHSLPPTTLDRIVAIITDRLADWPPQWEGFHWPGYTLEHTTRVRNLALALGEQEGADPGVVEPAALLHDIAKAQGREHARLGAEEADHILHDLNAADHLRARIVEAIALHSGDNTGDHPIENLVLGDADLIDANFGYVATWRFITIRAGHDMPLPETIAGMVEWLPKKDELQALLLTDAGRACAAERSRAMHGFCRDIAAAFDEQGDPPALWRLVEFIFADCARARLDDQLPRLMELAGDDGQAKEACERLRAEAAGEV
ncbi:MAG: HD domain-containing protein [Armatimonadetes bacterium]|nr:HD domain-containing protein [Armatimonadota bacterium]